jgi:hypothetical protein
MCKVAKTPPTFSLSALVDLNLRSLDACLGWPSFRLTYGDAMLGLVFFMPIWTWICDFGLGLQILDLRLGLGILGSWLIGCLASCFEFEI